MNIFLSFSCHLTSNIAATLSDWDEALIGFYFFILSFVLSSVAVCLETLGHMT